MTLPLFNFDDLPEPPTPAQASQSKTYGKPRLRVPIRDQAEMQWASLDQLIDPDHQVRIVWAAVCKLDLSSWLHDIKAVERYVGRDATDPRLLLSLWVYATLRGIGSARELDRLCREHMAYKWLCGGVSVNYHMLSDFRSQGGDKWDELLTQIVAVLLEADLVKMDRVAQDGMKVRASAGKSSFRRQGRLEEFLEEARQQVDKLKQLAEEDGEELTRRQRAARERAARERQQRIEEALRQREELEKQREASAKKSGRKVDEARASITDPEARTMKFADGGYRPGYNVQFATDTESGVIVGVEVTNAGTDNEQLTPMLNQLDERYDRVPDEALVDGGFATLDAIDQANDLGCTVYAPLKEEAKQREAGKDPHARKEGDSDAVAAWRSRMGTDAAKLIYRLRGQTAELVNAHCRNRRLWHMPVRGRPRCRIVGLLYAIAHNLVVGERLRSAVAIAKV
ncbi:MAG TPA: IS1182 family transposase [Planctomycetaceae bacterium]|jgi:transposase|nr:IS1182 family transposase [Planctomycetaceae bacterium]